MIHDKNYFLFIIIQTFLIQGSQHNNIVILVGAVPENSRSHVIMCHLQRWNQDFHTFYWSDQNQNKNYYVVRDAKLAHKITLIFYNLINQLIK